jgi:hypothetical protein
LAFAVLTVDPRVDAKKGSKQPKATDVITGNSARGGTGGAEVSVGVAQAGTGGSLSGAAGASFPGHFGFSGTTGTGVGGGLDLSSGGTVVIDNTAISGNSATTTDNDVLGSFQCDGLVVVRSQEKSRKHPSFAVPMAFRHLRRQPFS